MNWKQLAVKINAMTPAQQEMPVKYVIMGDVLSPEVHDLEVVEGTDILEGLSSGQPVLVDE